MSGLIWVPLQAVLIIHDRQIARHGGASGIRDVTLLEAACDRARNKFEYGQADVFQCAGAYGYGICKAHAFFDGNKRTAFVTMLTFMRMNGWSFRPDPIEGVQAMENLATDQLSEDDLISWLEKGVVKVTLAAK